MFQIAVREAHAEGGMGQGLATIVRKPRDAASMRVVVPAPTGANTAFHPGIARTTARLSQDDASQPGLVLPPVRRYGSSEALAIKPCR